MLRISLKTHMLICFLHISSQLCHIDSIAEYSSLSDVAIPSLVLH